MQRLVRSTFTDEMIEGIVGKGLSRPLVGSACFVALGIITGRVDRSGAATGSTGGSQRIDAGQLMRCAIAGEILLIGAGAIEWSLPGLAQVGIGVVITIHSAAEAAV